jgi:hypothetical protein
MASKARWIGCTRKGMLKITDASSSPTKLKVSRMPRFSPSQRPIGEAPPNDTVS